MQNIGHNDLIHNEWCHLMVCLPTYPHLKVRVGRGQTNNFLIVALWENYNPIGVIITMITQMGYLYPVCIVCPTYWLSSKFESLPCTHRSFVCLFPGVCLFCTCCRVGRYVSFDKVWMCVKYYFLYLIPLARSVWSSKIAPCIM